MPSKVSFYDLLDLPEDATPEEIRRVYREAALKLHPDVNADPTATETFMRIQEAYDVLSDPSQREAYDKQRAADRNDPVKAELIYSRSTVARLEEPQLLYVLMNFSPARTPEQLPSPPLNICLVLDRSTSMQGERMDTVKKAAIELVRQLKSQDIISVVVFSDRAEVLVSAAQQNDRNSIENLIRMIRPGGGTEIFQGLEAGFTEIQRSLSRSSINHLILITDGRTYGDEDTCLNLAEKAAHQGVRFTGLGIGTEWNDIFLDELTWRTGGSSFYISRASDIQTFLQKRFGSLNNIYAEPVWLNLDMKAGVTLNSIFRLDPDASPMTVSQNIRVGSIPRDKPLSILLEFIIPPVSAKVNRFNLAAGALNLTLLSPTVTHSLPIHISRLIGESSDVELPPRAIFQALSQITIYRMQERARKEVVEGKVQDASLHLQRLATQLLSVGERELAQIALTEAENIQKTHLFSSEGEKRIKYGTRSLLLPAHIERKIDL